MPMFHRIGTTKIDPTPMTMKMNATINPYSGSTMLARGANTKGFSISSTPSEMFVRASSFFKSSTLYCVGGLFTGT